jgi:DNA-binding CsgD family transcriptional regulator/PAS domain-containing protein
VDLDTFSRLTGLIYDAGIDSALWPAALEATRVAFRGRTVTLLTRNVETLQGNWVSTWDAESRREFWGRWRGSSPLAAPRTPRPDVVETDRTWLPDRGLFRTPFYNEFQRPREVYTSLAIWLDRQGAVQPTFSVSRPPSVGEFERADIEVGRLLRPHIQRAVTFADRLRQVSVPAAGATEALDLLRDAVLVLDRFGRPLHVNKAAERMLAARDGLSLYEGRLRAATPLLSDRLDAILARAAGRAASPPVAGAMALPRPSGGPPLALLALPIRDALPWLGGEPPAVCVCLSDPAANPDIPSGLLASVFGLTPAEAAIARALLDGKDVGAIAERLRLSAHTVRTHLVRIREKTGTRRQSELVGRLLRLPPFGE